MRLYVYIDVLFFWNTIMNFILLYITKSIRRKKTNWYRMIMGAVFGAGISCLLVLLPEFSKQLGVILSYGIVGTIMVYISFSWEGIKSFFYDYLYFMCITFILAGMLLSIVNIIQFSFLMISQADLFEKQPISLLHLIAMLLALLPLLFILLRFIGSHVKKEKCNYIVLLQLGEQCITCKGFLDTGNSLYDPCNGKPVILVNHEILSELYLDCERNHPEKLRSIPYHCIGKENGLLKAIRFDQITMIHQEETYHAQQVTAALSEYSFGRNSNIQVLLHQDLIGNL